MIPVLQRFTAKWRALVQRFTPQSASVRNVLKLASGTAGSQVITVAAAPILTRLYGPESFGVLATFASILAMLNEVSSLRYELAIAVPENDDDAIALVWLCFVLVAISTLLTGLCVALLGNQIASWLHQPALKPLLWLLPVGVLLNRVFCPLSYLAIRRKQFGLLAKAKFRQSIYGLIINLVSAPLGTMGLLLGQVVSQSAGFVAILRWSSAELLRRQRTKPIAFLKTVHRYSNFGIYTSAASLINTIGSQVPILIFASAFGTAQLGQLALAQRLLLLPAGLIGGSVSQVFLSQASDRYRTGTLALMVKQASKRLMLYGSIIAVLASVIFAPVMPILFGDEWSATSWIIPLLCPLFLGQLIVSPLSMAFLAAEKNESEFYAQSLLMGIRILPIIIATSIARVDFAVALSIYSVTALIGYLAYLIVLMKTLSTQRD